MMLIFIKINKNKLYIINSFFFAIISFNVFIPYILLQLSIFEASQLTLFTNFGGQLYVQEYMLYFTLILACQVIYLYSKSNPAMNIANVQVSYKISINKYVYILFTFIAYSILVLAFLNIFDIFGVHKVVYFLGSFLAGILYLKNPFMILNPLVFIFAILADNASRTIIFPYIIFFLTKFLMTKKLSKTTFAILGLASIVMIFYVLKLRENHDMTLIDIFDNIEISKIFLVTLETSTFFKMNEEVFYFHNQYGNMPYEGIMYYMQCFNPFPTQYISYDFNTYSIGVLSGININTLGMPTPAFLEFYFYFGWSSLLIYLLIIYLVTKLDNKLNKFSLLPKAKRLFIAMLTVLTLYAFIKAGHSSFRSVFRLHEALFIAYLFYIVTIKFLPKKRILT